MKKIWKLFKCKVVDNYNGLKNHSKVGKFFVVLEHRVVNNKICWLSFFIALTLDVLTKTYIVFKACGSWVFAMNSYQIAENSILFTPPISDFFNLVLVFNRGVSFSMFYNNSPLGKFVLFFLSLIIIGFLLEILLKEKGYLSRCFLTLAIAGALGNAIDRLRYGAVVDFLDFHWAGHHWPAFNVADMCIVVGISSYVVLGIFKKDS